MKLHQAAIIIPAVLITSIAQAELALAPHYTNHMVLQRDTPIIIRGTADPNEQVTVTIGNNSTQSTASKDGTWRAELPSRQAGGPHAIAVSSGDESLTLRNVLIGDVWLCSGQSNMHWQLSQTDRGSEFIQIADNDQLRMLQVKKVYDRELRRDVETIGWRQDMPETAARFSAVGYHFGRLMHDESGVPIGLIQSTWGGTPLEAWTPLEEITSRPDLFADRIKSLDVYDLPNEQIDKLIAEAQKAHEDFAAKALELEAGETEGWHTDEADSTKWPTMPMRGYIEGELGSFNGVVWLKRDIHLDEKWNGAEAELRLGRMDDFDTTWVNGVQVGETLWDQGNGRSIERRYDIPAGTLRAGKNTIAIRLLDVRSSGGIVPDNRKFELFAPGVARLPLEGDWSYKVGLDAAQHGGFPLPGNYAVPAGRSFRRPAALYNAMIHPLTEFPIAGVLWYQGESNAGRGDEYAAMFPLMIESWRKLWTQNAKLKDSVFPFIFVQLPNYRQRKADPSESSWADLREAQRLTLERVPRTGMAVTIDIGDPADIHPANKLPVAQRMARVASQIIGSDSASASFSSGLIPRSLSRSGSSIIVDYQDGAKLQTQDGSSSALGFALAGEKGIYHWAQASIERDRIVVHSKNVPNPQSIRYAWADNPAVNVIDQNNEPISPFQHTFETKD